MRHLLALPHGASMAISSHLPGSAATLDATRPWPPPAWVSTDTATRSFTLRGRRRSAALTAVADNREDYDDLYRLQHQRVLRLCRLLLSDPDEAEEVSQDVFVKLLKEHRIDTRGIQWGPWLTRVAVN